MSGTRRMIAYFTRFSYKILEGQAMKIKRVVSILIILCFSIIWPSNAKADLSEINEHEQRVIDEAAVRQYTLNGKTYITTSSGIEALKRKMRTVDLDRRDADNLIDSEPTEDDLEEQLAKGYIKIVSDGSTPDSSEQPTTAPQPTTAIPQSTTAIPQSTTSTPSGVTTSREDISNDSNTVGGDTVNNLNQQVNQQDVEDSGENSNKTVANNYAESSNIGGQSGSISQSSQKKSLSIWNAIVSDSNAKKQQNTSNSLSDEEKESDEENLEEEDSTTSSKKSSSDAATSLVEETLSQIEAENRAKSKFSSYKMLSKEDAGMQIICKTSSDEVKFINKNGETILSYTDSSVTSKGIEGNVVHVEWMIPFVLVLLFISIVCVYAEFKQHARAQENGVAPSQKTRKILSIIMRLILTICILIVFIAAGLFSGMLRSSSVMQALNNSSYYEYAYTEMAKNTVRILEENNIDSLTLADTLNYDDFVLVVKQQIEKQLSTPDGTINIEKTQENVNTQINEYYKNEEEKQIEESGIEETKKEKKARKVQRKEKANVITNSIMTNYKKYADFYPSHFIRQVKRDLRAVFQVVLPVVALIILTNIIALYHLFRRRYKGIGYIGGSVAVSALIACAASGFVYIREPYTKLYLSPEYLYQFILTYLNSASKIFLVISVFLVVLAIVILVLNRIIFPKKRRS